ncbi:hypothetical protein [Paracoccus aerodenitrificans]|uniref:hypothetical protein n=1 Tax=Paracoccus aerodenitrificans TaxID=3017781 RepID=UPI0022F0F629|nr:hypothetical protein [Paracoccus aerodenitrificans]WBU65076.1 hypothetical protein PAE61_06495 [Paracoccus aerodenitrificans]
MFYKNILFRLAIVLLMSLSVLIAGIWLGYWGLGHLEVDGVEHAREIGHLLGLSAQGADGSVDAYYAQLLWLPDMMIPITCRILHLDAWVVGILFLPAAFVLLSFGFDFALRDPGHKDRDEEYM